MQYNKNNIWTLTYSVKNIHTYVFNFLCFKKNTVFYINYMKEICQLFYTYKKNGISSFPKNVFFFLIFKRIDMYIDYEDD